MTETMICPHTRKPCAHTAKCDPPYDCYVAERFDIEHIGTVAAALCTFVFVAAIVFGMH